MTEAKKVLSKFIKYMSKKLKNSKENIEWYFKRRFNKKYKEKRLNRSMGGDIILTLFLCAFGIFSAWPLVFAINAAFKPLNEIFLFPPRLFVRNPTFDNFSDLVILMNESWVPFSRYLFNTLFITAVGTAGHVIFSSMAAYPLAKHKFFGSEVLFKIVVLSLMFSTAVTSIPNYITVSWLGLIDTYWAVIFPAFAFPLGLYLMKQFMEGIPISLIESAKLDGANELTIYWKIVMPLVKPAWLTLIILLFQQLWATTGGNFIYSENLKTLSYALSQVLGDGIARTGVASAITLLMMSVPILVFVISQSNVLKTMSTSGMK